MDQRVKFKELWGSLFAPVTEYLEVTILVCLDLQFLGFSPWPLYSVTVGLKGSKYQGKARVLCGDLCQHGGKKKICFNRLRSQCWFKLPESEQLILGICKYSAIWGGKFPGVTQGRVYKEGKLHQKNMSLLP